MQEIICLLDKSGSMQNVKNDAVGGFNAFLEDQKKYPSPANLTLAWFDDTFEISFEGNIQDAKEISHWPSGGMTALYDGIGKVFQHVSERFTKESPEKVIFAILTDGEENNSKEYSKQNVADLIKEHQDKYGWEVIFLAADQDAWAVSSQLNIKSANTIAYASLNTKGGFADYSRTIGAFR